MVEEAQAGTNWTRFIPRIEKEEASLVGSLCLLHFLVICAFTVARVARDGILLSKLPVQYLPYIYLGLAASMGVCSWVFGRLTHGAATHRALSLALAGTGGSLLLMIGWLRLDPESAAIALYLWTGVYGPLLVSEFWSLANERINPRQARRLFGIIGAGGILGGLAGGALGSLLGRVISPQGLVLVVAALYLATVALAERSGVRAEETAPEPAAAAQDRGIGGALRRPYVRWLVLLFLLGNLVSAVLDYEFKYAVQQRWASDVGHITSVVGAFYGLQSLLALIAQLGLTSWLLSRFGARPASLALPAGVLAGSALTAGLPVFGLVMGTRLYDATLRVSMARTAGEFLFFPLPDEIRRPARRFIDGLVSRGAEALAGLMILLLNWALGGSVMQLAVLAAVLSGAWLVVEMQVSRRYGSEVSRSLHRMLENGPKRQVSLREAGAAAELQQLLDSPDERRVLYAVEVLQSVAPDVLREKAPELLRHPSPMVRARSLTLPALRESALHAGAADRAAGGAAWEAGAEPEGGGTALRRPGQGQLALELAALFEDPELDVRRTAYRSAALSGERRYVPLLIERLGHPADRKEAREALATYGNRIVGTLGDHLVDTLVPLPVRREVPRVLADIGTGEAAWSLLRGAELQADRSVVHEVLRALNRIGARNELLPPAAVVGRHLREEVEVYLRRLVQRSAVRSVPDSPAKRLLLRVLGERLDLSLELIFRRLALLHPTRDILLAHRGLTSPNARLRAQSMEVLDTILTPEHKQLVQPLLDDAAEEERARRAAALLRTGRPAIRRTLLELLDSTDCWLYACSLYAIGTLQLTSLRDQVDQASLSANETVRQMAEWARAQLETSPIEVTPAWKPSRA